MKFVPQCLSCFIDDITGALVMLGASREETVAVLRESLEFLSAHVNDDTPPSSHITELHRIVKRRLGMEMPFKELRESCLRTGTKIAGRVEQAASALDGQERFSFLLRWAVAANSLDFRTAGAGYHLSTQEVEKTLTGYFETGLGIDQSQHIYKALRGARRIVYVPDNVGELPFDKLLVGLLSSWGAEVTVPFRGGPITSDAVMADADAVSMRDVAARVILSGPDTLGISFTEMSDDLTEALSRADAVIAKGQANYYVLSEDKDRLVQATVACLFTAKCRHVWERFGLSGKASIAAIIQEPGGE
jgi:damage-control phosphatase, subfamily I